MALQLVGKRVVPFYRPQATPHTYGPREWGTVEVWVDIDELARKLGPRALTAKGRAAREASGAVVVNQVV